MCEAPGCKVGGGGGGGGGSDGGLCRRKESWGEGYTDGFLTQNEGPTQRCGRGRRNTKEMIWRSDSTLHTVN